MITNRHAIRTGSIRAKVGVAIGLLALPLAAAAPVSAAPSWSYGTGTYALTGVEVHSTTVVGDGVVVEQTLSIDNAGVLTGPSTADLTCTFDASGAGACVGLEEFTGSVGGRTGSAVFAVGATVDADGFHGTFVAIHGEGGLAGLRGYGTFEGFATGVNDFHYAAH